MTEFRNKTSNFFASRKDDQNRRNSKIVIGDTIELILYFHL